ncbi:MAPEG family protein [Maricaulis sp. CAU 1757]
MQTMLSPVLALILWSLVMWAWMYATRIPAMYKAGLKAGRLKEKSELDVLPLEVRRVADNYNHLHEQPVIFYALCFYSHLVGVADELNIALAFIYVALRITHSLIQALWNYIPVRFFVFVASSLVLVIIALRNLFAALV